MMTKIILMPIQPKHALNILNGDIDQNLFETWLITNHKEWYIENYRYLYGGELNE